MATRVHVQAARPFDHLYDPLYTASGHVDHFKANIKATASAKFEPVPNREYMFSELPHYPRAMIRRARDANTEVPDHVPQQWTNPTHRPDHVITGDRRALFFKRPLVATFAAMPDVVQYEMSSGPATKAIEGPGAPQRQNQGFDRVQGMQETGGGASGTRTIGTQSLYREADVQTDPCTLDYVVKPGDDPEVLTLKNLTFGNGLPVSNLEIAMIERTRQKRLFEHWLPPPTDEFSYGVRSQLMEEHEFREWAERERVIKELQDRRLTLLQQAISDREQKIETKGSEKVERLRRKKEEEKDRVLARTQRQRIKLLRKVYKDRQAFEQHHEPIGQRRKDPIVSYSDFSSTIYAPVLRDGYIPDSKTAKIEVQPADLNTYSGLTNLEASLPGSTFKVSMKKAQDDGKTKFEKRREEEVMNALKSAMASVKKDGKVGVGATGTTTTSKKYMKHILERPETPSVKEGVLPEQEEMDQAVLLVQRLLRGRAFQNIMFEGKEKRLDLINELRLTERATNTALPEEEEKRRALLQLRERALDGVIEGLQGQVVSQTLDQLSKELLRFQEERRIAVMVKLAERDRRLRQAAESGRRQAEERLREREDETFRQIMCVHQGTVDSYLEDVLSQSVSQAARARALQEAKLRATQINDVVDEMEHRSSSNDTVVRQLVGQFLLPHVQRQALARRIQIEEKRFAHVAKGTLVETVTRVEGELGARPGRRAEASTDKDEM